MIMTKKITDEPGFWYESVQKRASNDALFSAHCVKCYRQLAQNFCYNARANGTAAFTDCETQTVVHRDRVDQGNNHF